MYQPRYQAASTDQPMCQLPMAALLWTDYCHITQQSNYSYWRPVHHITSS